MTYRIGIDLGGTKIEIAALMASGDLEHRVRVPTPPDYRATIDAIAELVGSTERALGPAQGVGIGIPGTISPATGLVKNANSERLNGNPFDQDVGARLGRQVRVSNDANCFAMSEAADGAGAGANCVFGVIIGTGCGGGIVVGGRVLEGRQRIAGEWGHTPLPWPKPSEMPMRQCWCGKVGCLETYVAGPALAAEADGIGARDAGGLPARAQAGDERATRALALHAERLARGLAMIVNIIDPDVIVLGGGLSNLEHLYRDVPSLMKPYVISDTFDTPLRRNLHGDSSGVRGAAWLWPA